MQAQVTAPNGYLISCVAYLVSSNYAVSVRQSDGTYSFSEASLASPAMLHTGCQDADPVVVVNIQAIVKSEAGPAARFVLGYTVETVPASAPPSPVVLHYMIYITEQRSRCHHPKLIRREQ